MKKKKYVSPVGYGVRMDTEELLSLSSVNGDAGVTMGSGDPGVGQGQGSAASRGSFWDDTE